MYAEAWSEALRPVVSRDVSFGARGRRRGEIDARDLRGGQRVAVEDVVPEAADAVRQLEQPRARRLDGLELLLREI